MKRNRTSTGFFCRLAVSMLTCFFMRGTFAQLSPQVKDSLIQELFIIDEEDQKYRNEVGYIVEKQGESSPEVRKMYGLMKEADSLNLLKVSAIIDRYGWLGPDVIGSQGNTTLFMVIQHSDLKTQLKYLPLMREAVAKGNARGESLALLEDRVQIYQGKRQIYGSQIGYDPNKGTFFVFPLEDPDQVDARRAKVGLGTLAEYTSECCELIWDLGQYKKDLPALEADFFKKGK